MPIDYQQKAPIGLHKLFENLLGPGTAEPDQSSSKFLFCEPEHIFAILKLIDNLFERVFAEAIVVT